MKLIKLPIIDLSEITGEAFVCPICGREIFASAEQGLPSFLRAVKKNEKCGDSPFSTGLLCRECQERLEFSRNMTECLHCGRVVKRADSFYCQACGENDACCLIRSVVTYDTFSKRLVLGLKIDKRVYFAKVMADYMWDKFKSIDWSPDVVTAVPTYTQKKRYFNHSELIAKQFCRLSGLPFSNDIVKIKKIDGQETKTYEERLSNVKNVFDVVGEDFAGRSVLLIDDVRTSGATLNEAAKTILEKGKAERVFGLTFAGTKLIEHKRQY